MAEQTQKKIEQVNSEAFLKQEKIFEEIHKQDTDVQLIQYVQECAKLLGRRPNKVDVIGYTYLKKRLGPWHRILEQAGLKEKTSKQVAKEERKRLILERQERRKNKKRKIF